MYTTLPDEEYDEDEENKVTVVIRPQKDREENKLDVCKLRQFIVGYFLHMHPEQGTDESAFAFDCNICSEGTIYHTRPKKEYNVPLCLSTECLYRQLKKQLEDGL